MAKRYSPLVMVGLLMLVGCQAQSTQSSVVDNMPAAYFSGPLMRDDASNSGAASATAQPAASQRPAPADAKNPVATLHPKTHGGIPADWIPFEKANSWQWIVIHHSATTTGGAVAFDKMHRAKGWDELGYHFVVGNGTDTRDGQIEVGSRWPKQKWGAHTKTPDNRFNEHGIGICLVGNFDVSHPSDVQLKSLAKLVSYLMKTYHIPADHVVGHRDCKSTDCPGKYMSIVAVRKLSTQLLVAAGDPIPQDAHAILAQGELLHDQRESASR